MKNYPKFQGFSKEAIIFLKGLRKNNNRDWFQENKSVYKIMVEEPANSFLEEMSGNLKTLSGAPMDGKVFRIYRDVRFSKDKTPYNAHVRMSFVRQESNKKQCGELPMFSISIEPDKLILGLGYFEFSKDLLMAYQKSVANDATGKSLEKTIVAMDKKGFEIEGATYKRVPSGYPQDHVRSDLLKRKGLTVWTDTSIPKELFSEKAIGFCIKKYRDMLPMYKWLDAIK